MLEYISNIFVSFKVIYIHTVHVTVYTYMVSQGVGMEHIVSIVTSGLSKRASERYWVT